MKQGKHLDWIKKRRKKTEGLGCNYPDRNSDYDPHTEITADSRMLALSFDMAATASSCVANSTSASPVTLPSGPISTCTLTGFRGEKNYGEREGAVCYSHRLSHTPFLVGDPTTHIVDVSLCGSVGQTPHVNTVTRGALEGGAAVTIPPIRHT